MAGIEVATGELMENTAEWIFGFTCPKCHEAILAKDKWGCFCAISSCNWGGTYDELKSVKGEQL